MNKILILEPFYTNFHIDLSKHISDDIEVLVFNLGNILYLRDAKKTIAHKKIIKSNFTDIDLQIAKETQTLYTETLRKIENREPSVEDFEYMARYVSFLRTFLKNKGIELVAMHNDLRWQHALAIKVCKELKIRYLITERGIFRPDTTTIDFQGVNGHSSLPKNREFYENLENISGELKSYKVDKLTNLKVNMRFSLFILLNKIGDILGMNSKIKNRGYSFVKYINLFIKQKFSKKSTQNIELPKEYIFIPLQVNTDTQILIHSEFKNMQEFITKVEKDFYGIESNLQLVFKIHPMEKGIVDYDFDNRSIVVENNTNELVEKCEFLITINSTVGFEAMQEYKKVIVLGNAFFKIEGLAICSSKKNFLNDLEDTLINKNKIDNHVIEKFVSYLKYGYQINGNLFNYDIETLEMLKSTLER